MCAKDYDKKYRKLKVLGKKVVILKENIEELTLLLMYLTSWEDTPN